jgi:hypothetical protein
LDLVIAGGAVRFGNRDPVGGIRGGRAADFRGGKGPVANARRSMKLPLQSVKLRPVPRQN